MINNDMRPYIYTRLQPKDSYGMIGTTPGIPEGSIRMAIYVSSQSIQDNIMYKNCNYVGLTNAPIDDTYIIEYEGKRLKVLYVNTKGRYKQVFLQLIK